MDRRSMEMVVTVCEGFEKKKGNRNWTGNLRVNF
jgi:hypothetical protein